MKILSRNEVKEIEEDLGKVYGHKPDFSEFAVFITSKENKIWLASRDIFNINLKELRISSGGLYLGRIDNGKMRLSIECAQLVAISAKKNICEIEDVWNFLRGFDIKPTKTIECDEGEYVIVKHKEYVLGIAKFEAGELKSVMPKSRKITSLTKYEY